MTGQPPTKGTLAMMRTAPSEIPDRCARRYRRACLRIALIHALVVGLAIGLAGRGVFVRRRKPRQTSREKGGWSPGLCAACW